MVSAFLAAYLNGRDREFQFWISFPRKEYVFTPYNLANDDRQFADRGQSKLTEQDVQDLVVRIEKEVINGWLPAMTTRIKREGTRFKVSGNQFVRHQIESFLSDHDVQRTILIPANQMNSVSESTE